MWPARPPPALYSHPRSRCFAEGMVKRKAGDPTFLDVLVERLTTLRGGLLKKPLVLATRMFGPREADTEFVQLRKGEQWLVHATVGPMQRQRGLARTRMVEQIMAAAIAACETAGEADIPPGHVDPPPHDPMAELAYEDAGDDVDDAPPPAIAGDAKKARRRAVRDRVVQVEAPAKCREMHPGCKETRQVTCYVQWAGRKQVWISLDDVPWLVRVLHDQATLGGVPMIDIDGDSPPPALAGGEAAAQPVVSWDFAASAWVAEGKQLKPNGVSPEDAAALGVDADAWRALSYAAKKGLAYKVIAHWSGQ